MSQSERHDVVRAEPKVVGGLHCFEVLEKLSDFVDGALSEAELAQVKAHLSGCDACTSFGGEFSQVVTALRGLQAASGSSG